ncbi:LuxR family transcriptional regulator [Streptomyces sp. G-G2]|uniref:helix-turn-helix transcriptional regulator n=1 Tax=Streptomyces sp. G-G2 TaxID=3046201 RepID=UPI0024B9020D|nr:LuxR family transcriptional regulator [Streptomyces sp. G-G2]MDJ0386174.1 AAA family ATPase [Streptomyces sp. G-G2]
MRALSHADDLIEQAEQRGGVLFLEGGPGTGKTFLLDEVKRRAEASGFVCLPATGYRDERDVHFSILEQFVHASAIPDGIRSALRRIVGNRALAAPSGTVPSHDVQGLVSALVSAAAHTGILILVDDVHHVDPASQSCLLHLARRAQSHRITLVMACPRTSRDGIRDHLEFLGLSGTRLVEVANLREEEVGQLLERATGVGAAAGPTGAVHRISGGNPALATALVRDLHVDPAAAYPPPVRVGAAFRTAYVAGLVRHPPLAETVRAIAVLGDDSTPLRAARLLERPPGEIEQHLAELDRAGLLENGGFRHPAVPGAVLSMLGAELPDLHRRAAALLFTEGAPAPAVAQHLVAADDRPDPSQVRVLRLAWQQLLMAGQPDRALACLRLADRAELGPGQRGRIIAAMIGTLCYVNPLAAEPEVNRLLAAARAGEVDCGALRLLVLWFLWFGGRERAREVMTRLVESCEPSHTHDEVRGFQALIGCLWPDLLADPGVHAYFCDAGGTAAPGRHAPAAMSASCAESVPGGRRLLAPSVTAPAGNDGHDAVERPSVPAVINPRWFRELDLAAVLELTRKGEMTLADRLCEEQWSRLTPDELPARKALLGGLRAHIRWNLGDLRTAAESAAYALELLPDRSWGVAVGMPLSVLIAAHTLMGEPHQAVQYLERPVPDEMWDSSFGPLYRIARGRYLLESGRPHAALTDFTACAPADESRERNPLGPLGWRAHAAEAYLALGEPERARRLVVAEIVQGDRPTDARGRALAVLAALDEPGRRRTHLEEAERTLRATGSRLSLARVLGDLSHLDLAEGLTHTARARWSEARGLATECGAPHRVRPLAAPLDGPPAPAGPSLAEAGRPERAVPASTGAATGGLTEAERQVASLAAAGRSNRQIGSQLYITVSTVEQHLTRVYRKLAVQRRSDLTGVLGLLS